jgi:hypothetical protein
MYKRWYAILFLISAGLLVHPVASAQLEGSVSDKNEVYLPGAIVTAFDSTGKIITTSKADQRGVYMLKGLKPGKYKIETKSEGFTTLILENIKVTPAPKDADENDDTRHAIRLDIILKRPGD